MEHHEESINIIKKFENFFKEIFMGILWLGVIIFSVTGYIGFLIILAVTYGEKLATPINIFLAIFRYWVIGIGIAASLFISFSIIHSIIKYINPRLKKANEERRKKFFKDFEQSIKIINKNGIKNRRAAKNSR